MSESDGRTGLPITSGRGLVTLLAVAPLVLAGFVVGYGVGVEHERGTPTVADAARERTGSEADYAPSTATFTATGLDEPAPDAPAALPVGTSQDLGITVPYIQFAVDESHTGPHHTAELRLPVLVPPEADRMMIEVASVRPVGCTCELTADAPPPYGRVWDTAFVGPDTGEAALDVTGALDAPGRYAFAVTAHEPESYFEFEGVRYTESGPVLRTVTTPPSAPSPPPAPSPTPTDPVGPDRPAPEAGQAETTLDTCRARRHLVPSCGTLVGAAAGAHTNRSKEQAFLEFERTAERGQHIYHAYERADRRLFPTEEQIALATDPQQPRTLFINWKPRMATWGEIAAGDPEVDEYLERLADHIKTNFDQPFFFTVHHEPENDVIDRPGSGMEATDYPAMFRYVVEFLRERGVDNLVTVMNYMGYLKWVETPWHDRLYPGDDVVDWIGLSGYGNSLADDGHSDFTEIVNEAEPEAGWPGFYHWTGVNFPDKPVMLAEWGVFTRDDYPHHQETVFDSADEQFAYYPRLKAIVYFSSPDAEGRDSEVDNDPGALRAFRDLMAAPRFDVELE
ncbi:glycoside hydrolase family 26 protein [Glycomyces xiaoerkulensis]|uniref:glycoside hydrolase family 26 protein n=1 Tax=Glycomyces xiaoerkulensis TaxID=2038139 RepID=UPI000C265AE6|nr:glycosyl hydrolase [Glycomyces xiaoerkulensis]